MKAKLKKQVHGTFATLSSSDVWLKLDLEIEFTPFVGLTLIKGEIEEKIIDLYYEIDRQLWVLFAEEDNTFCKVENHMKDYKGTPELENLVNEYLQDGWERD